MKKYPVISLILLALSVTSLFYIDLNIYFKTAGALVFFSIFLYALIHYHLPKCIEHAAKDTVEMKKKLSKINFELQVASSRISSVASDLEIEASSGENFADRLHQNSQTLMESTNSVNVSVKSVIEHSRKMLEHLSKEAEIVRSLSDKSGNSSDKISSNSGEILMMGEIIGLIDESSKGIISTMNSLVESTKRIKDIMGTVSDISDQTHMLALNASIESARAGEYGKGFAIVADEVRNLSVLTNNSAQNVNSIINEIDVQLGTMTNIVGENSKRVQDGVSKSRLIAGNLRTILEAFEDIRKDISSIEKLSNSKTELTEIIEKSLSQSENELANSSMIVADTDRMVNEQKSIVASINGMSRDLSQNASEMAALFDLSELAGSEIAKAAAHEQIEDSFKIIKNRILSNPDLLPFNPDNHKSILESLISSADYIEAAWTNDANGRFIYSIPQAGITNAKVRNWFRKGMEGENFISPVYVSAITKEPCITLSMPIRNTSNAVTGVAGIDIRVKMSYS
ncbi:MAG TPA: methyl-accepting chemotaxis protein [Spirochaetota bacterium]|nr:methyl-accepting chemotaxis protein [Spirochaetota bacterium]HOR45418.1 methyl-accepting chemotaxis protein [Spirochaetota bacterium]HPK57005.1 methyl-accepting chemotaxis protein [Spirochaetota bacterium]